MTAREPSHAGVIVDQLHFEGNVDRFGLHEFDADSEHAQLEPG
jgi:hypothetical protein